jgi:hypothetical protein
MSQQRYDPCSKWLLEQRGAALLWVAGVRGVLSCRTTQGEVVHPRQLPDGLLDVSVAGHPEPLLMLVEVATYPEGRVAEQMCDDLRLVRQARGVLPDAVVLCLCPRGSSRIPESAISHSRLGLSSESFSWKVLNLWEVPAEALLEAPDVGAVPWATLGRIDGPPEVLLRRCKDRIEKEGGDQREGLLAVSQVFATLHFDRPDLLSIFGGTLMKLDIPVLKELAAECAQAAQVKQTLFVLGRRFGPPGPSIEAGLALVKEEEKQLALSYVAATCADLAAFEEELRKDLPQPAPTSTRGRRKPKKAE